MTHTLRALTAVAAILAAFGASAVPAQPYGDGLDPSRRSGGDSHARFGRVAEYLDLDASQAEKWLEIQDNHLARASLRHDEIADLREQFRHEANQGTTDFESLGRIAFEIHQRLESGDQDRAEMKSELMALLTSEQVERFEAIEALRGPARARHGNGRRAAPRKDGSGD